MYSVFRLVPLWRVVDLGDLHRLAARGRARRQERRDQAEQAGEQGETLGHRGHRVISCPRDRVEEGAAWCGARGWTGGRGPSEATPDAVLADRDGPFPTSAATGRPGSRMAAHLALEHDVSRGGATSACHPTRRRGRCRRQPGVPLRERPTSPPVAVVTTTGPRSRSGRRRAPSRRRTRPRRPRPSSPSSLWPLTSGAASLLDGDAPRTLALDLEHAVAGVDVPADPHLVATPPALEVGPVRREVGGVEVDRGVAELTAPRSPGRATRRRSGRPAARRWPPGRRTSGRSGSAARRRASRVRRSIAGRLPTASPTRSASARVRHLARLDAGPGSREASCSSRSSSRRFARGALHDGGCNGRRTTVVSLT